MADKLFTSLQAPLTGDNYHDWKFAAAMILRHQGCWDVISGTAPKPSSSEDLPAWEKKADTGLTIIGLTVDRSQYTYIRDAKNGVEAWQKLKDQYEKDTRATRISLKRQLYGFQHDTHAPMQTYIAGITDLVAKLSGIGIKLTDNDVTDVLIFNLNNDYATIASTLMASKEELKPAEVTGALLEEERRRGGPPDPLSVSLFGKGKIDGRHRFGNGQGPPGRGQCFRCGRNGHQMRDCTAQKHANGGPITEDMEEEARKKISSFQTKTNIAYAGVSVTPSLNTDITYY